MTTLQVRELGAGYTRVHVYAAIDTHQLSFDDVTNIHLIKRKIDSVVQNYSFESCENLQILVFHRAAD